MGYETGVNTGFRTPLTPNLRETADSWCAKDDRAFILCGCGAFEVHDIPKKEIPQGVASGDLPLAWTGLVTDSGCLVMVMDSDATIHYANDVAARLLNQTHVIGKRLHELTTAPVAQERVEYIREAIASVRSITVDGMIAGYWRRITYRPIPAEPGQRPRVLAVGRMASSYLDKKRTPGVLRSRHDDTGALGVLSKREIEILCFIGEGLSAGDIAKQLHRSVKTIEWHRVALGTKLGIGNRVELARIAIRAGLVQMDDGMLPLAAQT